MALKNLCDKLRDRWLCSEKKPKHYHVSDLESVISGSYVVLELNRDILANLHYQKSTRFPPEVYNTGVLSGLIKAVYADTESAYVYLEILSVESGKRYETSVYFHEVSRIRTVVVSGQS